MKTDYEKKIQFALKLLRSIPTDEGPVEVAYSTGKDSDVILQLAKEAGIPFRAIYKNTTIDCVGSVAHAKEMGVEIVRPKKSFFELIREKGTPTRWQRFCCGVLKEYKILDRVVLGVRRAESNARAKRYQEPELCRKYGKGQTARHYYPILEWTNEDVERFIKERGLKCHPHYYDKNGNFHVERRVGCIACPLMNEKSRIEVFRKYPKLLKLYIKNFQRYMDSHPNARTVLHCDGNPYNKMFFELWGGV